MTEPIKGPLFDALVKNAIAREDVVNGAQDRARSMRAQIVAEVMAAGGDLETAVDVVMAWSLRCALPDLAKGGHLVARELATEAAALKTQDPRTLPPLRDVDVAAARSAAVSAKEGDQGNGEGPDKGAAA